MGEHKLLYKEAEGKRAGYAALLDTLIQYKNIITEHLTDSKIHLAAGEVNTRDDTLQGDYYDIYIERRNAWIQEIQQIQNEYDNVIADIDNGIADARNKMNMWVLRIQEGKGE